MAAKPSWNFAIVVDLKSFVTALKAMDAALAPALRAEFKTITEDIAGKVRGMFPHRSGAAASSVRVSAAPMGAVIRFGGDKAPYAPWLDFGGSVGRGHTPGHGGGSIQRPFIKTGRYLYPAISDAKDETAASVNRAIIKVAHGAGFEAHL